MSSEENNNDNYSFTVSESEGANQSQQSNADAELVGFGIEPKYDCPHFNTNHLSATVQEFSKELLSSPCKTCKHVGENWICLTCQGVYCSRYVNSDMSSHNTKNNDHCVAFSFTDASFWCYKCDSYISNQVIKLSQIAFSKIKHGDEQKKIEDGEISKMAQKLLDMHLQNKENPKESSSKEFTYDDLVNGLKDISKDEEEQKQQESDEPKNQSNKRQFKKVVFLTGAGISVSAGIPDFRTPGSGLYSQLEKYQLPYPEAIFEITYFKKNPQAFYTLSKEFLTCGSHSTISHFIIAEMNRRNRLLMNFSQNIDGLEIEAGLPEDKLIQAHGHFRTSKCTECFAVNDIQAFYECAKTDKIFYCTKCEIGIVKPDIVFFGESLPQSFFKSAELLDQADLVFVMGTSLKVYPFAALIGHIEDNVPIVLVNRENPGIKRNRFLFLEGDIDNSIEKLLKDINWDFPEIKRTYPPGTIDQDKSKL